MPANETISKCEDVKHWQKTLSNKYNAEEFAKLYNCKIPIYF